VVHNIFLYLLHTCFVSPSPGGEGTFADVFFKKKLVITKNSVKTSRKRYTQAPQNPFKNGNPERGHLKRDSAKIPKPRGWKMIEILRTRRSVRKYENKAVEAGHLEILKEALLRCPTSRGINPWTFVFVDDRDLLHKLSMAKEHGSTFLKDAALGIVVCGDETRSDVWVEDCSIAAIVVQLTAHSLGLGTCWIQIRNRFHNAETASEKYIQELLGIPENLKIDSMISIGYPAETKEPVPQEKLAYDKIKYNRCG
jgi:nitroreductase